MGKCFGRCLPEAEGNTSVRTFSFFRKQQGVDFTHLVEDNASIASDSDRNFFSSLLSQRKSNDKKPVLELVDNMLNPSSVTYSQLNKSHRLPSNGSYSSKDIQLQCLDAHALLVRTTTSTTVSSIELEWEHETLPTSIQEASGSSWSALLGEYSHCPNETSSQNPQNEDSDWSRISSANSLEWDSVPNTFHESPHASDIDTDTQMLLSEIERLTNRTLEETGRDLDS